MGVVDMSASRPFMSLTFAKTMGYTNAFLDTRDSGEITALNFRPGGWHQLGGRNHRARYWGLGTLTTKVNIARADHPARLVDVTFMVFKDSALPTRS